MKGIIINQNVESCWCFFFCSWVRSYKMILSGMLRYFKSGQGEQDLDRFLMCITSHSLHIILFLNTHSVFSFSLFFLQQTQNHQSKETLTRTFKGSVWCAYIENARSLSEQASGSLFTLNLHTLTYFAVMLKKSISPLLHSKQAHTCSV